MNQQMPYGCTLKDYRKSYASPAHYKTIRNNSIVALVLMAINVAAAGAGNTYALVDVAIQAALVFGVYNNRNKTCALGLLLYAVVSMGIGIAENGTPTGWLWLALGISYLQVFKKIDKDYQMALANQQQQYYPQYPQYPQYPR